MVLQEKRVLITGGARRIGAAAAQKLAQAGCRVIIHCNHSVKEAEILAAALPGNGHRVISADLSTSAGVEALLESAGQFEFLVNSAAIFHRPGSPEDLSAAENYRQINFLAPSRLLEYLYEQNIPGSAAVNITDAFALLPGEGAYWESKRDLNALTVELAPLWAKRDMRINAVAPGPMLPPPWAPESRMEKILQTVPLRRPVAPDDLTAMIKFLLFSTSVTGTVIPLDGGITAAGTFSDR